MDIYGFTVSKNSWVYRGLEAYLTLIQCRALFSYKKASKPGINNNHINQPL